MRSVFKNLFICFFIGSLSVPGFAQSLDSALIYFEKGKALRAEDPEASYEAFLKGAKRSKAQNDWTTYINCVNYLARLGSRLGEPRSIQSLQTVEDALVLLKSAKVDSSIAMLHYNAGELYLEFSKADEASHEYEKALKIWTSGPVRSDEMAARCYHGLGDIYKYFKYDFYRAEKAYENSLTIRERLTGTEKESDSILFYQLYYSLAATNRSQRDFEKAISYGSKALELARHLSLGREEESYVMMANIFRHMEDQKEAMNYYRKAIHINNKTKNHENRAWYYQSAAEALRQDSSFNEAIQFCDLSYATYQKQHIDSKELFLDLLRIQLDLYDATGDHKRFTSKLKETFEQLELNGKLNAREAYDVYIILGDRRLRLKDYDSALVCYKRALTAVVPSFANFPVWENTTEEKIGLSHFIYEALIRKSHALTAKFRMSGDVRSLGQSLANLVLAEKLLSKARNSLDMESSKWTFLDRNYNLYENILSNIYEGQNVLPRDTVYKLAFRYMEQSKSRSLADALTDAEQSVRIGNQDSLFQRHTELKRELLEVQAQISEQPVDKQNGPAVASLRGKQVVIDRGIQLVKQAIEELSPGYFNVRYGYVTPSLNSIQKILSGKNQVLVEYFWGTDWVYAIGLTGEKVLFEKVGRPLTIQNRIDSLLIHLNNERASTSRQAYSDFTANAFGLYETLVKPFGELLSGKTHMQIIPDGPINQLPFEILIDSRPENSEVNYRSLSYLIKSFAVGYAYSSSMLTHKSATAIRKPSLLAVGFTGGKRLRAGDPSLEEIMGAEQELEALARRFGSGKFLVGKDATEANFKVLSPKYDIIHLAIHGRGDVEKNFSSSLYFRSKYDSVDDGELHAYELYGLKLKAMMAVLSACESGLGKGYKGEGMISMASAFTYSGCENILMSLWKVNDQASTVLMDDFYHQLLEGETIDEALRKAKLSYLESADELSADPKIWAPLVAYGSLDQVFKKERSEIYWIAFATIAMISLLIFLFRKRIF